MRRVYSLFFIHNIFEIEHLQTNWMHVEMTNVTMKRKCASSIKIEVQNRREYWPATCNHIRSGWCGETTTSKVIRSFFCPLGSSGIAARKPFRTEDKPECNERLCNQYIKDPRLGGWIWRRCILPEILAASLCGGDCSCDLLNWCKRPCGRMEAGIRSLPYSAPLCVGWIGTAVDNPNNWCKTLFSSICSREKGGSNPRGFSVGVSSVNILRS